MAGGEDRLGTMAMYMPTVYQAIPIYALSLRTSTCQHSATENRSFPCFLNYFGLRTGGNFSLNPKPILDSNRSGPGRFAHEIHGLRASVRTEVRRELAAHFTRL